MPAQQKPLVYFIRHGQTDWNAEGRFQGQNEVDLNETGRKQADRNGHKLATLVGTADGFDFVASPMRRTVETMQRVRRAMNLPVDDFRTDARLVEVDFGDWQGKRLVDLEIEMPDVFAARQRDKWNMVPSGEGAESYQMLLERMRPWFEAIDRQTVCVAHGGILRAIFRMVGGLNDMEAADLVVPQDRILKFANGELEWL